jgi:hypothetical protein
MVYVIPNPVSTGILNATLIKFLTQTQISSVPNTVTSVHFKKVIPNLMTASILTKFYDQRFDNKQ